MKSFRARIVIWTSVVAGLVMLGFGIAGNFAFEKIKLRQVDDSMHIFVARVAAPPTHSRYWDRMGGEIRSELEHRFGADAVVAVYGYRESDETEGEKKRFEVVTWGDLKGLFEDESALPLVDGLFDPNAQAARFGPPGPEGPGGRNRGRSPRVLAPPPLVESFSVKHGESGDLWRVSFAKHRGFNVLFAVNYEKVREDTVLMRRSFAVVFPIALIAMGASIWFFVTKAIRPVGQLSAAIENVSAQRLDARLSKEGVYSEFSSLIEHFNGMLERLERSFTQATRFSADAAHELKTPLAILQGQLEVALQNTEDGSEQQGLLAGLLEETHRLKAITRKLLILAKADAGTLEVQREKIDLRQRLKEWVELAEEDDPSARIVLDAEGAAGGFAAGDDTLIRQILNNLIGNALKYRSPREEAIRVELRRLNGRFQVEIENSCEPLSVEARGRLFDRFVRADAARNRSEDGTGLGLSLSLEFAKAQGGSLEQVDASDERRLRMRLTLPEFVEPNRIG
ncbi:ATP-binding protein [Pelagicoccus mobilis]|uniref:histidine kinase n=1 Tax=Pelagicoccus mobilis TaxID=415221 RepID=A0A934RU80_9BACT|nr:ATP-binding protein [Pelagicoccus mobilis]MBK1876523.1 HAMP domain-containing protein [Pelagicoccus mobilis]